MFRNFLIVLLWLFSFQAYALYTDHKWHVELNNSLCSLAHYLTHDYSDDEQLAIDVRFGFAGDSAIIKEHLKSFGVVNKRHMLQVSAFFQNVNNFNNPNYPIEIEAFGVKLKRLEEDSHQYFYMTDQKVNSIFDKLKNSKKLVLTIIPTVGESFDLVVPNDQFNTAFEMYKACASNAP